MIPHNDSRKIMSQAEEQMLCRLCVCESVWGIADVGWGRFDVVRHTVALPLQPCGTRK